MAVYGRQAHQDVGRALAGGGRGSPSGSQLFLHKADADALDAEIKRRKRLGGVVAEVSGRDRVSDSVTAWWEREAPTWARNTCDSRASMLHKWIEPYLGHLMVRELTTTRIRQWRTTAVSHGASASVANKALSTLSAFMGTLVEEGKLMKNPCGPVKPLPEMPKRPKALSPVQVERIRAHLPTVRDALIVGLMAYAGLRPEEVFALDCADVGNVIVIDRAWTAGQLKPTKTNKRRTIEPIAPLQEELRAFLPKVSVPGEVAFPADRGGRISLRNWRARTFYPACEKAGVKATPYDLRHTYCSLLAHEGRSAIFIAQAMGHSLTETQRHYTHIIDDATLEISMPMEDAIQAARLELSRSGVSPVCTESAPRILRRSLQDPKNA